MPRKSPCRPTPWAARCRAPGTSGQPKAPAKIGHKQIQAETGLRARLVRELGPHLSLLAARYGLEDPVAASVAADVARIREVYKSKPLPEWKNGKPHLREIADETHLLIRRLAMPECRAVIAKLAATNGVVRSFATWIANWP